jgi:hypothetical protein
MTTYDSWKTTCAEEYASATEEKLAEAQGRIDALQKALHEIIDMADEQADVDEGTPNLAMRILVTAENAL